MEEGGYGLDEMEEGGYGLDEGGYGPSAGSPHDSFLQILNKQMQ